MSLRVYLSGKMSNRYVEDVNSSFIYGSSQDKNQMVALTYCLRNGSVPEMQEKLTLKSLSCFLVETGQSPLLSEPTIFSFI